MDEGQGCGCGVVGAILWWICLYLLATKVFVGWSILFWILAAIFPPILIWPLLAA